MDDERSPLTVALESVIEAQNVKITRIIRSTRLLERFGDAGRDIIELIGNSTLTIDQSTQLVELARRYNSLREEIGESGQELVDAEENLSSVYQQAIKTIWKETNER